jgi:Tfp pilus assembly protein PilO
MWKGTPKMVDRIVRTIVEHPKRKMLVIILTFVTGVVLVLPAVEEYSAAQTRRGAAREKLDEASGAAANLPQMQTALLQKKRELQELEHKAVTEKDVEGFRDELQKLIREVGCEMREVYIEEVPTKRPWMTNDSPLRGSPPGNSGPETPFVLAQWNARLRIEGPMGSIYKFLTRVSKMDRFIHTRLVEMKRSEADENQTQLRMEVTLYDLERKKATKDAA